MPVFYWLILVSEERVQACRRPGSSATGSTCQSWTTPRLASRDIQTAPQRAPLVSDILPIGFVPPACTEGGYTRRRTGAAAPHSTAMIRGVLYLGAAADVAGALVAVVRKHSSCQPGVPGAADAVRAVALLQQGRRSRGCSAVACMPLPAQTPRALQQSWR